MSTSIQIHILVQKDNQQLKVTYKNGIVYTRKKEIQNNTVFMKKS